ncbi:MAG: RNA polymerase sigma-70 factor [Cyclobacteriaceae bacterium]
MNSSYINTDIWSEKINSGNINAFSSMYDAIFEDLYKLAKSILMDENVSKDLVQDVFIDVWEKRDTRNIRNYPAYLKKSVKYKIAEHLRKSKFNSVQLEVLDFILQDEESQFALENKELYQKIDNAINNLPLKCREIFQLSRFENKNNSEIAKKLEISQRTVENQIYKAIKILKASLATMILFLIC